MGVVRINRMNVLGVEESGTNVALVPKEPNHRGSHVQRAGTGTTSNNVRTYAKHTNDTAYYPRQHKEGKNVYFVVELFSLLLNLLIQ